jgi:hypothetical protein
VPRVTPITTLPTSEIEAIRIVPLSPTSNM